MNRILCIETATKNCSVAIFEDGKLIASHEEYGEKYSHSELLTAFIEKVLEKAGVKAEDLDGVCVGKGPGSYTGLRIGVSVAKGLSYSLDIPLLSMNTTEILFHQMKESQPDFEFYIPLIDARRMEVYTAVYSQVGEEETATNALIVEQDSFDKLKNKKVLFAGDGTEKCVEILSQSDSFDHELNMHPSAKFMGTAAEELYQMKRFEDTAYFEPYYLKDFVAGKMKKVF